MNKNNLYTSIDEQSQYYYQLAIRKTLSESNRTLESFRFHTLTCRGVFQAFTDEYDTAKFGSVTFDNELIHEFVPMVKQRKAPQLNYIVEVQTTLTDGLENQ